MSANISLFAACTAAILGTVTAFSIAGAPATLPTPATETAPATPPARGGRGPTTPASISSAMGEMNRMLIAIGKESTDPAAFEQTLKDIATLQRDVAISKALTPPTINRMTNADEKAKAMADYRASCNSMTRTLLDLEDAVNAKKPDDVKNAIAKFIEIGNQGHKDLKVNAKIGG